MNDSAYVNLFGAIIKQAINDLFLPDTSKQNKKDRKSAINFFKENAGLDDYCAVMGLDSDFIRNEVNKIRRRKKKCNAAAKS